MKNQNYWIITVILLVIIGAGGFFAGMKYQESHISSARANFSQGMGGAGGYGRRFGAGQNGQAATRGQIVKSNNGSITVKLSDGSTKLINVSSSTQINKTEKGSVSDLTQGQQVLVIGKTNSDGSIEATTIQLGIANMFGPRPSQLQGQ